MNYFYQLSVAIVAGAVGAWVATQFALHRFYSEKWWEKRATAFIELTDAIYQLKIQFEYYSELREYNREGPEEFPNFTKLNDKQLQEMHDAESKARKLIIKFSQVGPLLITEKASKLLRIYLQEEVKVYHDVHFKGWDTEEAEEHLLTMAEKLFNDILDESKKALKAN